MPIENTSTPVKTTNDLDSTALLDFFMMAPDEFIDEVGFEPSLETMNALKLKISELTSSSNPICKSFL